MVAPPESGIKDLKEFLSQLAEEAGTPIVLKKEKTMMMVSAKPGMEVKPLSS